MTLIRFKILVSAIVACVLAGCGYVPDSQVVSGPLSSSPKGNSHLIVGLSSKDLGGLSLVWGTSVSYQLRFVKYDPATGLTNKNRPGAADYGKATLGEFGADHLRSINFVAIPLESGPYVLDRITVSGLDRLQNTMTFTTDHRATEFTPKFQIRPGEVLYVGNFMVEGNDARASPRGGEPAKYIFRYDGLTPGGQQFARQKRLRLVNFREVEFSLFIGKRLLFGRSR